MIIKYLYLVFNLHIIYHTIFNEILMDTGCIIIITILDVDLILNID